MLFPRILARTLWLLGLAALHCQCLSPQKVGCIDPKEWTYTQEIIEHDESTSVEGIVFEKPNRVLVIAHSPKERYPERAFYASEDEGETWRLLEVDPQTLGMFGPFEELHTPFYLSAPSDERIAYSSVLSYPRLGYRQDQGIYRSEDGGKSWKRRRAIDATTGKEVRIREGLAVDPIDSQRLYATDWPRPGDPWGEGKPSGLYVSDDGGDHVRLLRECKDWVYLLRVNPFRRDELILVVRVTIPGGGIEDEIIKSVDGGSLWVPLSIGEIIEQGYSVGGVPHGGGIKDVRYSPWSADTIYVVSTKGLFRSRDGGTSWCMVLIGKGVDYGLTMKRIAFDPNHEGVIYLATWYGLYRSRDDGHTWEKIDILKRLAKR